MSDQIAQKVNAATLSSAEAWTFYNAIYTPKIFYPAKLTTFKSTEWDTIMRKFINGIIRHMGFDCHTSRSIIYGPRRLGGVGIMPGIAVQGSEGLLHLLSHVRSGTEIGKLMLATVSKLQLLSGGQRGLFEYPRTLPNGKPRNGKIYRWHHLGWGWLLSVRHFLHSVGGKVIIPTAWSPQLG